ncbi:hypothetical protein Plhal703r1_c12g0060871 [Plasmopara halstedii]
MEGREHQDASTMRRSRTFSGRQIPLEMGELRVGGSGRPVPAVFPSATSKRARSSSDETNLSPHATIESFSQPFPRRKVEVTKTAAHVSRNSSGLKLRAEKVVRSNSRTCSPQIRFRSKSSSAINETTIQSTKMKESQTKILESSQNDSSHLNYATSDDLLAIQVPTSTIKILQSNEKSQSKEIRFPNDEKEDVLVNAVTEKETNDCEKKMRSADRTEFAISTSAGAGIFVSSLPSLTKLQSSFTARELKLFTQRLDSTQVDRNGNTGYHIASHPHSITATMTPHQQGFHERSTPPSINQKTSENLSTHKKRQFRSWQQVTTSLDHIYENDPSIDLVQLHLLHSHNTINRRKKRKQLEHERNLVAASGIRAQQGEKQRYLQEQQQRKLRLQQMSEAIRQQNQKSVKTPKSDQTWQVKRDKEKGPKLPERKPPVPRLSRPFSSMKPNQLKQTKKMPEHLCETSISIDLAMDSCGQHDNPKARGVDKLSVFQNNQLPGTKCLAKRKSPSRSRPSTKKKKQDVEADKRAEAAMRARKTRRALAREYMQQQQQSRRIGHARAKEQSQREKEKRQRQLEILDANRLKNLRVSQRKTKNRTNFNRVDAAMSEVDQSPEIATKLEMIGPLAVHDEVLSDAANENDQAIGNSGHDKENAYKLTGLHGNAEWVSAADERIQKLLELREKAAALSARLSGLGNQTDKIKETNTKNNQECSILKVNEMIESDDYKCPALQHNALVETRTFEQEREKDREEEESGIGEEEGAETHHGSLEREDDTARTSSKIQTSFDVQDQRRHSAQRVISSEVTNSIGMYLPTDLDEETIDIRSIGVHNIEVMWQPELPNESVDGGQRVNLLSSSSSSSSVSSSLTSHLTAQNEQWAIDQKPNLEDKMDEAFEVMFYQQLKSKIKAPIYAVKADEKESEPAFDFTTRALESGQHAKQEHENRRVSSPVNEGLMRLIRETDDSLSVVDRAAKKLYCEQQEKVLERKKEEELQERIQAEKEALVEKELALAAVIASVSNKKIVSEMSSPDEEAQSFSEEDGLELPHYQRLEDIITEVENECLKEKDAINERVATPSVQYNYHQNDESPAAQSSDVASNTELQAEMPSSIFWDHLVADTSESQNSEHSYRPHNGKETKKIYYRSRLQPRNVDEQWLRDPNDSHRNRSPQTLSQKLLAAVDYQEAILGAHMQLSKMEDAYKRDQELKQANLRECSVQTESLPRVDAATCAGLCVETSTSPMRVGVDAAVQNDATEINSDESSLEMKYQSEEDDEYGETFEAQSQSYEDNANQNLRTSGASSIVDSLTRSDDDSGEVSESDRFHDERESSSVEDDQTSVEKIGTTSIVDSTVSSDVIKSHSSLVVAEMSDASISMDYEDDFEASSPRSRVIVDRTSQEILGNVVEDFNVLESTERSREIEEIVFGETSSIDNVDEGEKSFIYRSNDSDCSGMKVLTEQTATERQEAHSIRESVEVRRDSSREVEAKTDGHPAAYLYDLERRKQAEESLLNLRLQTVEQKYQHEVKKLESAVTSQCEVQRRKELLKMAILAEKADIESSKAASVARYYQDLHTFQSLSLDWPHAVNHGGRVNIHSHHFLSNDAEVMSTGELPLAIDVSSTCEQNETSQHDEYADEFASESEISEAEVILEKSSDKSSRNADTTSKSSETSEIESKSNEQLEVSEMAIQAGQDFEQDDEDENFVEEEEQYDQDAFVSMSEEYNARTDIVTEVKNAESTSIDTAEWVSEHSESENVGDLLSVDENFVNESNEVAEFVDEQVAEFQKHDVADFEGAIEVDTVSSEIEQVGTASHDIKQDVQSTKSDQHNYSDDFESEHMKHLTLSSVPTSQAQSLSIKHSGSGQSESEDSSMTTLLVTEVAALQETIARASSEGDDRKLARKKVKIAELLHAKERLVSQQTEAFRRAEEKRHIDLLARLALQMDVEEQVRRAKDEIAQQVSNEFQTLQQKYSILTMGNTIAEKVSTMERHTPSVLIKLFGGNSADAASKVDVEYENEYETESFDEETDALKASKTFEVESTEIDGENIYDGKQDKAEENELSDEVESEFSGEKVEVDQELVSSIVDEENILNGGDTIVSNVDAHSIDDENDYENESFDDVQSISDSVPALKERDAHVDDEIFDPIVERYQSFEGGDVYSDENFDSASESFNNEERADAQKDPKTIIVNDFAVSENVSRDDEDLTEAIANVVVQLEQKCIFLEPEKGSTCNLNEDRSLTTSVSMPQSCGKEAESFTASIEERTARLEALQQQIDARKSDLLAVQMRMRVESRRGKLMAQEKVLWDEMEAVQKLLKADEAAVALCGQRNRLDMMQLEARHVSLSSDRKEIRDLLLGFDYIENAQVGHNLQESLASGKLARQDQALRQYDLLDGYTYIEYTEVANYSVSNFTAAEEKFLERDENSLLAVRHSMPRVVTDKGVMIECDREKGEEICRGEEDFLDNSQDDKGDAKSSLDLQETIEAAAEMKMPLQESLEQETSQDLLDAYAYVEDVEPVSNAKVDLLAEFEYVEIIETVELELNHDCLSQTMVETGELLENLVSAQDAPDEYTLKQETFSEGSQAEDNESIDDQTIAADLRVGELSNSLLTESTICTADNDRASENAHGIKEIAGLMEHDKAFVTIGTAQLDTIPSPDKYDRLEKFLDTRNADRVTMLLYSDFIQELDEQILTNFRSRSINVEPDQPFHKAVLVPFNNHVNIKTNNLQCEDNEIGPREGDLSKCESDKESRIKSICKTLVDTDNNEDIADMSNITAHTLYENSLDNKPLVGNNDSFEIVAPHVSSIKQNSTLSLASSDENLVESSGFKALTDASPEVQSERIVDVIFASIYDEVISSSLQLMSHPKVIDTSLNKSSNSEPIVAAPKTFDNIFESRKHLRERNFTHQVVTQLTIVNDKIHLPDFNSFGLEFNSFTVHALYDTIKDLACDYLRRVQHHDMLDYASLLARLQHYVIIEINKLLELRAQTDFNLMRQVQLISNEFNFENQSIRDVLVSNNCLDINVNNIVSKVKIDLCKVNNELNDSVPRKPVRVQHSSILSLLQTQQEQVIQQRIAQLLFDELLTESLDIL